MSTSVRKMPTESKREEWNVKHVSLPAQLSQGGDAVPTFSESADVSTLVRRYEALVNQAQHDAHLHSSPDVDKALIRRQHHVGEIVSKWEQMTGETNSIASGAGVVTVTPPQKPPRTRLSSNTAETTGTAPAPPPKPARCQDFVLHRNHHGQFGFSLLATDILERSFGSTEQTMCRIQMVCQAPDSQASLPVGRLVAVNFMPVQDKTTAELYSIIARSVESIRLRIQPLDFPQSVLQNIVSEQDSVVQDMVSEEALTCNTQKDDYRQKHSHPVKVLVRRQLQRVISVLTLCRKALGSCWH
ncbi:uncharacterized protein [Branchiostoma lanceolatum]|uniref:uncharacterized protein n=1 Tax=Branchiostoma lanceolatum TaxID=7740 RepID=UPI00345365AE